MDKNGKIAGVPRNVFFLGLVSFWNDFSAEMVQAVMPVFLTSVLGAPAFFVGLLEGVADALASVLKLFSGWVSDWTRRRKLPAVLGYAVSVCARFFLAFVGSFWQVFAIRMADRVGKGTRDAPRDALIAESAEPGALGNAFGFHRSMDTLGAAFGPLLAAVLLPLLGMSYPKFFLISFALGVVAVASFIFVRERPRGGETSPSARALPNFKALRSRRHFISVVSTLFIFGLGALPVILVLLKVSEAGFPAYMVPFAYFLYGAAFVFTAVPLGRLADKIGERCVIAGGFLLAAITYFGFAVAPHRITALLLFIPLGVYAAATDGLQRIIPAKSLPPEFLATGQGFLNMALGFSSLGAGVIGGFLWTKFGSSSALLYAGIVSVIGLILFLHATAHEHPSG